MVSFVDASHNMLHTLEPDKWIPDLRKSSQGDITGYQEAEGHAARTCVQRFCEDNNRGLYMPVGCGNPISWDRAVFNAIRGEAGVVEVHQKHPTARFEPARDICWRGLVHVGSRKKVLRINIHPVAGATKPQGVASWGPELAAWKDWALAQYMLDLVSFTAAQMSREYYDVILLGGDYNAFLDRDERWYYPGPLLAGLYVKDAGHLKGLDHLQHTHGSDVKVERRWNVEGHTDHPIALIVRSFLNVPDFPRQ